MCLRACRPGHTHTHTHTHRVARQIDKRFRYILEVLGVDNTDDDTDYDTDDDTDDDDGDGGGGGGTDVDQQQAEERIPTHEHMGWWTKQIFGDFIRSRVSLSPLSVPLSLSVSALINHELAV